MAYPAYVREKARELRKREKLTIDALAARLAIPRTTIYGWVRDMPIAGSGPGGGWPESARRRGNQVMSEKFRLLREAAYQQGQEEFRALVQQPTFRDFICMYIGEGYKRDRNRVAIGNSDPAVIGLSATWIRRLGSKPVAFEFQHHADQDPEELRAFWARIVEVGPRQIRFQRKSNSGQLSGRSWRSRYGVLQVRMADTYLRARLDAWMDEVRAQWS